MKRFNTMFNVGKAKYVVNFCDGSKKHPDGSDFFEIMTFTNKRKMNTFIRLLKSYGYTETN